MSMMYPGGQGIPGTNQFQVGGQPNFAAPLVNFGGAFNQGKQATAPAPQQRQPGAISPPSGPTSGGKAPGGVNPGDFAAKLRAFFNPQGQAQAQPAGVGFGGPAMAPPNNGAAFNPNGLY